MTEGLLYIEPSGHGNTHMLVLTEKGMQVADILLELEETLDH